MDMTPTIAIHLSASLAAVLIGPVALWARRGHADGARPGQRQHVRLHRAAGYAWVTLMLASAISALFIRDFRLPNVWGYTPIHLLIPLTLGSLGVAFRALHKGQIRRHRIWMTSLYVSACLVAGAFTLLPGRFLGQWVWGGWLGWI
ncbi:MAG TPA: DUF2306 domain-containing protein [Hydrogenophaga sp.]|uniref:DUF2306 domain-containing protein n=1 Tax=Hydrogenophaga sp. TaxID=1904254 RepID=UPI002B64B3EF|nr:DUF2306 domain-containing protein [Hydrogenophaga sp.]HMN93643.1 DUF2306 domain-containing protein [Hydrogenophaga sp.]HMP09516.1 DUF2306 domain-containing protein [Hydrogenophaga sp.]